ncbi:secG [Symbiodinium sp. CCMP2592]|nr:secG [Symbiodinium sp. CCMP2592]
MAGLGAEISHDSSAFADIADASADALICDLPSGAAHKASSDEESYMAFLRLAERILRPGGRCVLLSNRQELLSRCAQSGPWKEVCSWVMGRGEANILKFLLLVLERQASTLARIVGLKQKPLQQPGDQSNASPWQKKGAKFGCKR